MGERMNASKISKACEYLAEKHNADFASKYGEPGYSDPERGIIFADWNGIPSGLGDWLEKCGYALEWSDEWSVVDGIAYRTSPDCYSWECQIHITDEGEWLTPEQSDDEWCDEFSMTDKGQPAKCLPSRIDPGACGYTLRLAGLESGHHSGQADDLDDIARKAFDEGAERVVFRKTEHSQFYVVFECWVLS
jgi:hypothetical protein